MGAKSTKREEVLLRALLELYKDTPLQIPMKELNDMDSYRRFEEVRRCSNKELTVKRVRSPKDYATLGKEKSFHYVLGVPGMAYNPFVKEEARHSNFDFEQAVILNFWVETVRELGTITSGKLQLGVILAKRVVELSVPQLEGLVSFECGSWDGPLRTSLVAMWELINPSWCPNPNAGLIWDLTAEVEHKENDDESQHDLAVIQHFLALKRTTQDDGQPTDPKFF